MEAHTTIPYIHNTRIDCCLSPHENRKKIFLENVKFSISFIIRTQRPSEEPVLLLASLSFFEGHSVSIGNFLPATALSC